MLVTHQTQWLQACNRVLVMRGGHIVADGHWKTLQLSGEALPELSHVATELTLADLDETRSAEPLDSSSNAFPEATLPVGGGSPVGDSAGGSPAAHSGSAALRRGAAEASAATSSMATPRLAGAEPPCSDAATAAAVDAVFGWAEPATDSSREDAAAAEPVAPAEDAPATAGAASSATAADARGPAAHVMSHPVALETAEVTSPPSTDLLDVPAASSSSPTSSSSETDEAPTIALAVIRDPPPPAATPVTAAQPPDTAGPSRANHTGADPANTHTHIPSPAMCFHRRYIRNASSAWWPCCIMQPLCKAGWDRAGDATVKSSQGPAADSHRVQNPTDAGTPSGPQLVSVSRSGSTRSDQVAQEAGQPVAYPAGGPSSFGTTSLAGTASYAESEDSAPRRGPRHIFRVAGAAPPGGAAEAGLRGDRGAGPVGESLGGVAEEEGDPAGVEVPAVVIDVGAGGKGSRMSGSDTSPVAAGHAAGGSSDNDAAAAVRTSNEESGSSGDVSENGKDDGKAAAKGRKAGAMCAPHQHTHAPHTHAPHTHAPAYPCTPYPCTPYPCTPSLRLCDSRTMCDGRTMRRCRGSRPGSSPGCADTRPHTRSCASAGESSHKRSTGRRAR